MTSGKPNSVTGFSAQYRMGDLTLLALTTQEKLEVSSNTNTKNKYNGLGLTYKLGDFDLGLTYQKVKEGSAAARHETRIGVGYTPFKSMTFFADVAQLSKAKDQGPRRHHGSWSEVRLLIDLPIQLSGL